VGVIISLVALLIAVRGVRPERLLQALSDADYRWLALAAALVLLGLLARARSWKTLMGDAVPLSQAFEALCQGYLLNNLLPLRLGELGRAYIVSRKGRIGAIQALSTIVVERLIDASISLLGLSVALLTLFAPSWARELAWAAGLLLIGTIAVLMAGVFLRRSWLALLARLPERRLGWVHVAAQDFLTALKSIGRPRRLLNAAFWSLLAWTAVWVEFWVLMRMFGLNGSLVAPLFVSGVIAFGVALPASPGALGVYELAAVASMRVLGFNAEDALSVAIIAHLLQFLLTASIGAWGLSRQGLSLTDVAAKAHAFFRRRPDSVVP